MKSKQYILWMLIIVFSASMGTGIAQEGNAGVESPFTIGVGARALGMGNASVAYANDPSSFYWNPASMAIVNQKGAAFSLTTLFEGTQYHFIGYVHPTLTAGTFGFGIIRIGTGDIPEYHYDRSTPIKSGTFDFWWGKLMVSYAKAVLGGLSLGVNFNSNRQVMLNYSANGFGFDVGAHYNFSNKNGFLNHFYLGLNYVNIIKPRLRLGTKSEMIPSMIRFGFAKGFSFGEGKNHWFFLGDLEKWESRDVRYHFGTELTLNQSIFFRLGYDGKRITFGGGLRYRQFQIDYAMSQIGELDYFQKSHRFTLIFYLGKSITEQEQFLEAQRQEEIRRTINARMEADRKKRIIEGLQAGKEYLERGDYFNARLEFSRVLRDDTENIEAKQLLELTTQKEQELQKAREEELLRDAREKEKRLRDNIFVNQRFNEGLEALEKGDFQKAVDKWNQALERDPDNPQINTYIQKARSELEGEISRLITKAKQLIHQENLSEAYKVLEHAKNQAEGSPKLQKKVLSEIRRLDNTVNFITNYQAGLQRYRKAEYEEATHFFEKALQYEPNNERARELYRNALARSKGHKREMEGEVKDKFYRGIQLYRDGRYEEALKEWEETLNLDPHNIKILEAIEGAKRKLETFKKNEQ
jgi:tetratricopeptide (TPR) repeat protein